jgi:hypothetical protein
MDDMDRVFKALADPHLRHLLEQHSYFGTRIESDFAPGPPMSTARRTERRCSTG